MGPLADELLRENSKKNMIRIQDEIEANPERLIELVELFCHARYRIQQRSAWVVGSLSPNQLTPFLPQIIDACSSVEANDSTKRNTMRLLQFSKIPEELSGKVWDLSFELASRREESIAIRAFAIGVLHNLVKVYPELGNELRALLEQEAPYTSKGLLNRITNTLKSLDKLK